MNWITEGGSPPFVSVAHVRLLAGGALRVLLILRFLGVYSVHQVEPALVLGKNNILIAKLRKDELHKFITALVYERMLRNQVIVHQLCYRDISLRLVAAIAVLRIFQS